MKYLAKSLFVLLCFGLTFCTSDDQDNTNLVTKNDSDIQAKNENLSKLTNSDTVKEKLEESNLVERNQINSTMNEETLSKVQEARTITNVEKDESYSLSEQNRQQKTTQNTSIVKEEKAIKKTTLGDIKIQLTMKDNTLSVKYNSSHKISGFQFDVEGASLNQDQVAKASNFTIKTGKLSEEKNSQLVLGYGMGVAWDEGDNQLLVDLAIKETLAENICIKNAIFATKNENNVPIAMKHKDITCTTIE